MKRGFTTIACAIVFAFTVSASTAQTLNTVKTRGILNCGANAGLAGFGIPDKQGNWTGFDVDYCRAIAAAVFNDPMKVRFVLSPPNAQITNRARLQSQRLISSFARCRLCLRTVH